MQKVDAGTLTDLKELQSVAGAVAFTQYETPIRGIIEKWKAQDEEREKRGQDIEANTLLNQLNAWRRAGGQGDAPWNLDTLTAKLENSKLRTEQISTLRTAFESADEPDAVVGFRSRIYQKMLSDGKDDPLPWMRMESEIMASYRVGGMSKPEYDSLLTDLLKAKTEYEKRVNVTEEKYEFDAASIVYSRTMSTREKNDWLTLNRAHFSGDDYSKWNGRISPYNDDPDKKSVFDAIGDFYGRASIGDVSEQRKRELSIEEYYAKESMERIFIQNPEAPEKWNQALNSLLSDSAIKDLEQAIIGKLGAVFPATFGTPEFRKADILEAGREQGLMADNAALQAQVAVRSSPIRTREAELVQAKVRGINITKTETDEAGETIFFDDRNNVYYVETTKDGNRLRRAVYKAVRGTESWSLVGYE